MVKSIRADWNVLVEMLTKIDAMLQKPEPHIWVPDHVQRAQKQVNEALDIVQAQVLFVVGSTNVSKNLSFINNRLKGISYALADGEMSDKRAIKLMGETREGLTSMINEVSTKLDKQVLNKIAAQKQKELATGVNRDIDSEQYQNLTDNMQSVVRKLGNADSLNNIDKSSSRDVVNVSKIMERNKTDLQQMKKTINKSRTNRDEAENFVLLRGPVLTGAKLDENRLKASGIDYDIVYFPGINYGFTRKEETPRFYILRDQILVAIIVGQRKKFQLKLNRSPLEKRTKRDDANFQNMSTDVVQILEQKLHYPVVHVGEERNAYITDENFPGIRFMWLMKKQIYNKIGPFSSSNTLKLPF